MYKLGGIEVGVECSAIHSYTGNSRLCLSSRVEMSLIQPGLTALEPSREPSVRRIAVRVSLGTMHEKTIKVGCFRLFPQWTRQFCRFRRKKVGNQNDANARLREESYQNSGIRKSRGGTLRSQRAVYIRNFGGGERNLEALKI